jgi:hypothetical protein
MDELLYHIFVHNYNAGEKSISFDRINRLLSDNISEFEMDNLNYNNLFQLLKFGIIDKVGKNRYSLSNTTLISNTKNNLTLGVNLPDELLKINNHLLKKQYLGLAIFDSDNISITDYEINKMDFDLDNIINQLHPFNSIIRNWDPVDFNDLGQITKTQKYNSLNCIWENVKDVKENNIMYRLYLHNGNYFKYLFLYKNKYFLIEPYEYEKVNTLKLIHSNKSLFRYNKLSGEITLKSYHTYPVYLHKIMLINHIMKTGLIPENNHFQIELKQFLKITKILNLNYTLE